MKRRIDLVLHSKCSEISTSHPALAKIARIKANIDSIVNTATTLYYEDLVPEKELAHFTIRINKLKNKLRNIEKHNLPKTHKAIFFRYFYEKVYVVATVKEARPTPGDETMEEMYTNALGYYPLKWPYC